MINEYPPPILSNIPGTWAYSTVKVRLPEIVGRVIEENQYPPAINENLAQLQEDIKQRGIRPLLDQDVPDQTAWEEYTQPYIGQSWQDVPWFFAEHYLYRRIVEAVKYFQLGQDPLAIKRNRAWKRTGLISYPWQASCSGDRGTRRGLRRH